MDQQNMSLAGGDVIILLVLLFYLPLGMVQLNEITFQSLSVVVTLSLFINGVTDMGLRLKIKTDLKFEKVHLTQQKLIFMRRVNSVYFHCYFTLLALLFAYLLHYNFLSSSEFE